MDAHVDVAFAAVAGRDEAGDDVLPDADGVPGILRGRAEQGHL